MRACTLLLSFAFLVLNPVANAQQPLPSEDMPKAATKDPTAVSVITQSLAAVGASSLAISDSVVTGKISYPDGTGGTYKMETKGSAIRQQVDLPQTSSISVTSDGQGFVQTDGKRLTLPAHITKYSTPYYFPLLTRMAAAVTLPNASVVYTGVEALDTGKVHHVVLSSLPLDGTPVDVETKSSEIHVFIDIQTFTVVKTQTFHFSPVTAMNRSLCETYYSDYRPVQGVSVPFHITEQLDTQPYLEIALTDVLVNSGVSPVDFQ
jgi:hypothetical protein